VVSRAQLAGLGLGRGAILHRLERMRLQPVHRGVYAVGRRRLSRTGAWMAAVLACGDGAVLSHRSAAVHWGICRPDPSRTDVTAPRRVGRRDGIRAHKAILPADEITEVDGIPVTMAARTLFDLAATLERDQLQAPSSERKLFGSPTRRPWLLSSRATRAAGGPRFSRRSSARRPVRPP
jgi:hypothetical protein